MQTSPVRVLLTGCATALLLVTGCDVGTAPGDKPYGTDDVLRVFRSSGIHLESQRLEDGSTCPDPAAVAAIRPDGAECRVTVAAGGLPRSRAVLWNERELGRWVIWVYGSEDDARALEASPLFPNRVGPPISVACAGNVVAMYIDVEDGRRLRSKTMMVDVICDECGESFDISMGPSRRHATMRVASRRASRRIRARTGSLRSPTSPWTIGSRPSFAMR